MYLIFFLTLYVLSATSIYSSTNYDCSVIIDRMLDLYDEEKGWGVTEDNNFDIQQPFSITSLGVIGSFNVGKTWLINKLSGYALPSDTQVHTKGYGFVSIPWGGGLNRNILLDTEGLNSFVVPKARKPAATNQGRREAMLTDLDEINQQEMFRKDFTLNFSNIFIFITGQMSFDSQVTIRKLRQLIKKAGNKRLIVIHNLKEWTLDQLQREQRFNQINYIQYIGRLFDLGTDSYTGEMQVDRPCYGQLERHFFLTKESASNNAWNNSVLKGIQDSFSLAFKSKNSLSSAFINVVKKLLNVEKIQLRNDPKRFVGERLKDKKTDTIFKPATTYQIVKDAEGKHSLVIVCKLAGLNIQTDNQSIVDAIDRSLDQGGKPITLQASVQHCTDKATGIFQAGSRGNSTVNPLKGVFEVILPAVYRNNLLETARWLGDDEGVNVDSKNFLKLHNGVMYLRLPLLEEKLPMIKRKVAELSN